MLNKLWRYSINIGEHGGIVLADTVEEAEAKVRMKYDDLHPYIIVWKMEDDEYYDPNNPDVFDCYGL